MHAEQGHALQRTEPARILGVVAGTKRRVEIDRLRQCGMTQEAVNASARLAALERVDGGLPAIG